MLPNTHKSLFTEEQHPQNTITSPRIAPLYGKDAEKLEIKMVQRAA
jgi:hypothetical protein